jgi:hypothetical protein
MTFSERHGFTKPKSVYQMDSLDVATRNRLTSAIVGTYFAKSPPFDLDYYSQIIFTDLITDFFKNSIDKVTSNYQNACSALIQWTANCQWYALLDLLEYIARADYQTRGGREKKRFILECNRIFEEEKVRYRFIKNSIISIVDQTEVASLEESLSQAETFDGVKRHMSRAIELYSDRKSPDYRNAIKEAISAVESASKVISGKSKAGLADAINAIDKKHGIHPALKESLLKLYGYSSDKQGIRHALIEDPNVGHAEAKFMLIGCSAFCNYLIEQYGEK